MTHDIKKLITDYLDGVVGKKLLLYAGNVNNHTYYDIAPSLSPEEKTYRKIVSYSLEDSYDGFYISLKLERELEQCLYLGSYMPTFETID